MFHDQETASAGGMREDIEQRFHARLRVLEREAKGLRRKVRWLSLSLVAVVGLGATAGVGAGIFGGEPGELEATRIVLVNADGSARGEWFIDDEGNARFALKDRQERERLLLTVQSGGQPGMALSNAAGQRRVALGLLPDETTSLVFADAGGIPRAVLGLTGEESANLVFADREGNSRIGLGLDRSGVGSVLLPEAEESTQKP